jgi:O-antigen ligase
MNRVFLVNIFFIIYLIIIILNLNISFDLILAKSSFSALLYYSSIVCILISFLISIYKPSFEIKFIFGKILRFILFFFILYLIAFVSGLISDNFKYLYIYLPILLKSALMLFIFSWLFSYLLVHNQIVNYINWLTIIVLTSVFSIPILKILNIELSYLLYTDLLKDDIGRASGVFGNANIAAQFCVFGIILVLYNLKNYSRIIHKIVLFIFLIIIYYSLYLTFSNTGFLNALIITFFYFIIKSKNKVMLLFKLLIVFLLFQIFFIPFLNNFLEDYYVRNNIPRIQQEKIDNFINIISLEDSKKVDFSYRDELAEKAWRKIDQSPIIGHGLGSFSVDISNHQGVHNSYLQIIGETGFLIFIIYLFIFFRFIYKQIYQNQLDDLKFLVLAVLFSISIYMLTSHDVLYSERLLLFLVFIEIIYLDNKYFNIKKSYFGK